MMVVDASVVAKWFIPEEHAAAATGLLQAGASLAAPDLLWAELSSVFAKQCWRQHLSPEECSEMLTQLGQFPITWFPTRPLAIRAVAISAATKRSAYDCFYLALAEQQQVPLVTADRKFYAALRATEFGAAMTWIEDARVD